MTGMVVLLAGSAYAATNVWPGLGAGAVDLARGVLGDKVTSEVENFVLSSEDKVKQMEYRLLRTSPAAPWQTNALPTPAPANTPYPRLIPPTRLVRRQAHPAMPAVPRNLRLFRRAGPWRTYRPWAAPRERAIGRLTCAIRLGMWSPTGPSCNRIRSGLMPLWQW